MMTADWSVAAAAATVPAPVWPQETAPILCECRAYRQGRLGPHRDHRATYRRALNAGRVPDETAFALGAQS